MGSVDDMYLENLEEYVYDENKIVTYRWLSTALKINVNVAKQMLYSFLQKHKKHQPEKENLYVTYFVAGLCKNGASQTHKCAVVSEKDLERFKSSLEIVSSSHIYSIQTSKLKDSNALYTADYGTAKESPKFSAVKCPWAKVRTGSENGFYKQASSDNTSSSKATNGESQGSSKVESHTKPKVQNQKKPGGIAGMFANAAKKSEANKEVKQETVTDTSKKTTKDSKKEPNKTGVMSFFSKQTEKKSDAVDRKQTTDTTQKQEKLSPKEEKASDKRQTKKRKDDKDLNRKDKQTKRRRIQCVSDSSSEEEMDVEIDDDSPVPSPIPEDPESPVKEECKVEESPVKKIEDKSSCHTTEPRRKRRRKLVPKTTMDADGYMVTEKVWESESTDASDVEPPPKRTSDLPRKQSPQKKSGSPQKKSPPSTGNKKQANLMSFFKKK